MKGQVKGTHISGKGKWLLSLLVSLSLATVALPGQARAKTAGGLCPHHTEHTEDCGYAEAAESGECTHVHDENCGYAEESECGHVHDADCGYGEGIPCQHVHTEDCGEDGSTCSHVHDEDCGYAEAGECTHVHDENCGYAEASECGHTHDEDCGYVEGKEGSACNYVCKICPVQELIDKLPEADEITAENMEMVAAQLTAVDAAKEKLTDEGRELLITDRYEAAASKMMELQEQALGQPVIPEADREMAAAYKPRPSVYYPIYVAGVRVTNLNADNVFEDDPVNDGKVKYDPDTQTLILDGVDITYASSSDANAIKTMNRDTPTGRMDLTIQLLNENRIVSETSCSGSDEAKRRTIDAIDGLTFTGSGSLEIVGTASTGGPIITIHAGRTIKFENTNVTAIAGDCPLESRYWDRSWAICGESIQIIGGKVTARTGWATDAGSSTAITAAWGDIEISNNAEVIAQAGRGGNSYGLSTDYNISVSDSRVLAAGGDASNSSYGIGAGKLTLCGSEINAEAGAGESGYSVPIYCGEEMEINDSDVTAKGGTAGAESYGISAASFTFNGGNLYAEGGAATDWSIGLWTENANISAGRLVAIAGQAGGTNAITSAPNFINDYKVTVKAGTGEGDAKVIENPTEETYWGNTYVIIKPYHNHVWAEQWTYDESDHWHICTGDDCEVVDYVEMDGYGQHIYDDEYDGDCNICGAERDALARPSYKIIKGANGKWILNEDGSLGITGNGDFEKFEGVKVDDELLDRDNYSVRAGSTIVELKPAYLNTLAAGSHSMEILWTDGSASTEFTIAENTLNTDDTDNVNGGGSDSDNGNAGGGHSGSSNSSNSNHDNNDNSGTDNTSVNNVNVNKKTTPANTVVATEDGKKDAVPKTGEDVSAAWAVVILAVSGAGIVLTGKKQRFIGR